ncbi:NfeD family protein [Roseibium salinum]|nr:NfeD family protein [Roseibium salinum]
METTSDREYHSCPWTLELVRPRALSAGAGDPGAGHDLPVVRPVGAGRRPDSPGLRFQLAGGCQPVRAAVGGQSADRPPPDATACLRKKGDPGLNQRGSRYVGREFTLTTPLREGAGNLSVDDTIWRITGPDLPAGTKVRVEAVEGARLVVAPASAKQTLHAR